MAMAASELPPAHFPASLCGETNRIVSSFPQSQSEILSQKNEISKTVSSEQDSITQRNLPRTTNDLLEDKVSVFVVDLVTLIESGKSDDALSAVLDDSNEPIVRWACMDIFAALGAKMYDGTLRLTDPNAWDHCESILEYLTKFCKPKEALLSLLEFAERLEADPGFFTVVPLLKIAFIRAPSKRGRNIVWGLNVLYKYVQSLRLPEYQSLEENEAAALENSKEHSRLELCVFMCLDFCEPFISEAKSCALVSDKHRVSQAQQIASFLLKLVERPVAFFEVLREKNQTQSYECADRLVCQIFDLCPNPFPKICDWQSSGCLTLNCDSVEPSSGRNSTVSKSSIGALAYFSLCQSICRNRLPCVYRPGYLFELLAPGCIALLAQSHKDPILKKGVMLANFLLKMCKEEKLWKRERLSQKTVYQHLLLGLINAMTTCSNRKYGQKALATFQLYLERYEILGQIAAIKLVFERVGGRKTETDDDWIFPNRGICGWLIDWYRGRINSEILNSQDIPVEKGTVRYSDYTWELLEIFCQLKEKEITDLLDNFEQIMGALNLLRFLTAVTKNGKLKLKKELLLRYQQSYLQVLHKGIELSQAHFKLEMKNDREKQKSDGSSPISSDQMMNAALSSFDLIESLIGRVNELMNSL